MLDKPRREELDAILPPFERSFDLLPRLATGRLQDAMAWLHTSPEDEAKRAAALAARKNAPEGALRGPASDVGPEGSGTPSPKEKP